MAAIYNDGTVVMGSRSVTFSVAGALICSDISITRPPVTIEQLDAAGEPLKQHTRSGFVTGSATVQMVTSGVLVTPGETFTETFRTTTGAENFYVDSVTQPESQSDIKKFSITFRKRYN